MNLHPTFDTLLRRSDKETLLGQKSAVFWFTGLSGSGKTTLARSLEKELHQAGYLTQLLDGDNIRTGLGNNLGFSEADRRENIRRAAEAAKLFLEGGIITICCFISPTREIRQLAREIIGAEDFNLISVICPFSVCAERDVKGLYAKAIRGEIKDFTGLDSPYEEPESAFLTIRSHEQSLDECQRILSDAVLSLLKSKK